MKIAIIVAMNKELQLLLPLISNKQTSEINNFKFTSGSIGKHDVIAMQCGIGKVNSAIGTLTMIDNFLPDLVINTGVAGGADATMHVLDLFVAERISYHDVWCGPGTDYGAAHGFPAELLCDNKVLDVAHNVLTQPNIKYGQICSGDKFIKTEDEIKEIKSHFPNTLAVDMESASIAQVCFMKNIPVNIIRVISDTPGQEENISQYENFWIDAPAETFKALTEILNNL